MADGCRQLLSAIQRPGGLPRSPMEKFLAKCRQLFCGSTENAGKDSKHPHVDKILLLSGLFAQGTVQAGIYAMVDIWNASYDGFFQFCKSPSAFGGFASPHLRHHMAERVAQDHRFYSKARADPVRRYGCANPQLHSARLG